MNDRVELEKVDEGRVAIVSMARPRYRNPLSAQMMAALVEAFEAAEQDDQLLGAVGHRREACEAFALRGTLHLRARGV